MGTCAMKAAAKFVYTDRDGAGIQDPAIRAYGSPYVGLTCERAGAWKRGKALVRFESGALVVVRSRLLRKVRAEALGGLGPA